MSSEQNPFANRPALRPLIAPAQIQARVAELGRQISEDYRQADSLHLVGMLRGASFFFADLARAIDHDLSMDFMRVPSYGDGTESSGEILVTKDLEEDIGSLEVLIVEDIVDSGRTAACLQTLLGRRNPRSLRLATLLNKPSRRIVPVDLAYVGFEIPDHFVVGYGLDHAERYRNLPGICILEPKS